MKFTYVRKGIVKVTFGYSNIIIEVWKCVKLGKPCIFKYLFGVLHL